MSEDGNNLEAKKLILEDLGLTQEKLSRINSEVAADTLITFFQAKPKAEKEEKKDNAAIVTPANAGKLELPEAVPVGSEVKWNDEAKFMRNINKMHPANEQRWNADARSLLHFDEDGNPCLF